MNKSNPKGATTMPPKGRNDGKSSQRVPKTVPGQESGRVLAYGYKQAMKRMKYSQALVGKDLDQYQKILVSLINPNAKAMTRAFNCPEPKEGFTLSTSDGQVMEEVKLSYKVNSMRRCKKQ